MWMIADKSPNIYCLLSIIAKCQTNFQITCIFCFYYINPLHNSSSLYLLFTPGIRRWSSSVSMAAKADSSVTLMSGTTSMDSLLSCSK